MPSPATVAEFLELLERSQLVDPKLLKKGLAPWHSTGSLEDDPKPLVQRLIDANLITRFHADQLMQGRHKGFRVGKYKILSLLGAGGMGKVYQAEHTIMRRQVALKVLPKAKSSDPAALARFQREARAVAALKHPNIVHAYDIDQDDDLHFLVMEYVPGASLHDYVKQFGPIRWQHAADFICQAAAGLEHAAHEGLVHRDIKPGNLLLDPRGTIKLLDLGLAVFFHDEDPDPLTLHYNENVLGTADYLAPEQAVDSHNVDIRADIYSLGGTFYFLLAGHAPFKQGTIAQKLLWHQNKDPQSIRELVPELPERLAAIVHRMMAKSPDNRPQTPQAVMELLASFAEPMPAPFADKAPPNLPPTDPKAGLASPLPEPTGATPRTRPAAPATPLRSQPSRSPPSSKTKTAAATLTKEKEPEAEAIGRFDFLKSSDETPAPSAPAASSKRMPSAPAAASPRTPVATHATGSPTIESSTLVTRIVVGVVAVVLLVGYVALNWGGRQTTTNPSSKLKVATGPERKQGPPKAPADAVVVSAALNHHGPTTILSGLETARQGQTVLIEPKTTGLWDVNPLIFAPGSRLAGKGDIVLKGAISGVVIVTETPPLLRVQSVSGLVLEDLTLDGEGKPGPLVELVGDCAGFTLRNVTLRNFSGNAIRLVGARGAAKKPIRFERVTIQGMPGQPTSALRTVAEGSNTTLRHVEIVGGKFQVGAVHLALASPVESLRIADTILAGGTTGVLFQPGPAASLLQSLEVSGNTFLDTGRGVCLEDPPPPGCTVNITDNLFVDLTAPALLINRAIQDAALGVLKVEGNFVSPASATAAPPYRSFSSGLHAGVVTFRSRQFDDPDFARPTAGAPAAQTNTPRRYAGAVKPTP